MRIELPELERPAKLTFDSGQRLTDDEYFEFCMANPEVRFERTSGGEIIIVPPAGLESSNQSADLCHQLFKWNKRAKRGIVADSSAEFILPDGAAYSPDAAFVSNEKLATLDQQQRKKFPPIAPDFVIEVLSPSDRLRPAQSKMEQWTANGVQLGWLVDGKRQAVWIYRPHREPERLLAIAELAGEGPVNGFVADLTGVWKGL
ncbi:MAG: Uma2 family endonuclease [Bryobacteraceae bacterium]